MRRFLMGLGLGLLISSLVLLPASLTLGETSRDQGTLRQLIERTRKELLNQKKKEKSVLNHLLKEQQNLNKLEHNYNQVSQELTSAQKNYNNIKQELTALETDLSALQSELGRRQELLNERLIVTYKYGPQTYLEILFNAQSFGDLVYKFNLISLFVKSDLKLVDDLEKTRDEYNRQHQLVTTKTDQAKSEYQKIAQLRETVAREQLKISSKVRSTQTELSQIQSNRAQLERALAEYEQTSKELERQIRRDQQHDLTTALGSGTLIWPVRGRISSDFGWRYHPVLRTKKYHNGLDLAVPKGTPVLAADDGVVLVSGWQGGYGNFVAIDHGKGTSTCYGHNSVLLVKVGERVSKGQKIALAGSTGLSTGPHVHFEVRRNGTPVNPIPYLP